LTERDPAFLSVIAVFASDGLGRPVSGHQAYIVAVTASMMTA